MTLMNDQTSCQTCFLHLHGNLYSQEIEHFATCEVGIASYPLPVNWLVIGWY